MEGSFHAQSPWLGVGEQEQMDWPPHDHQVHSGQLVVGVADRDSGLWGKACCRGWGV